MAAGMFALDASAAIWKGGVTRDGSPVAGATVTICGASATTNGSGRFKVEVQGNPKTCPVTVSYKNRNSSAVKVRFSPQLSLVLRSSSGGWVVEAR